MSDITSLSLTELVKSVKDKKLSSTEITKSFIERSEKSKKLNTYITEDFSSAINKGLAVEPSIMPNDKEKFHKDISRGIKIFGPTRKSDYQLFRDAAYAEIENYL